MCFLCVQAIASCQSELLDPSISEGERARLEGDVQTCKGIIQDHNARIAQLNSEMVELMEERAAISGKGEPPGCHANGTDGGCHRIMLLWSHVIGVFTLLLPW